MSSSRDRVIRSYLKIPQPAIRKYLDKLSYFASVNLLVYEKENIELIPILLHLKIDLPMTEGLDEYIYLGLFRICLIIGLQFT